MIRSDWLTGAPFKDAVVGIVIDDRLVVIRVFVFCRDNVQMCSHPTASQSIASENKYRDFLVYTDSHLYAMVLLRNDTVGFRVAHGMVPAAIVHHN
jgi:hypothetical protein